MQVNGIEVKENYTQEEVDALVARSPYYKATANDIDWLQKVRMQGRIQRWVDHSISVTIRFTFRCQRRDGGSAICRGMAFWL